MKSFNMESGYINEDEIEPVMEIEGGQLKSVNGHKYVVNHHTQLGDGYYITKGRMCLYLFIVLLLLFGTFAMTYYLFVPSCSYPPRLNGNHNDSVHSGSILRITGDPHENDYLVGNGETVLSDDANVNIEPKKDTNTPLEKPTEKIEKPISKNIEDEIEFHDGWLPDHYDLFLEPDTENSFSNGTVTIWTTRDLRVKEMKPIVLDIKEIEITSCRVTLVDKSDIEEQLISDCEYGKNNNTYVITLKETKSEIINITIDLEFTSKITNTLQGFYRGSYYDKISKNQSQFYSTQFSPIDARRVFPCFDTPGKKATFKISLTRPAGFTCSLSNMPLAKSTPLRNGYVRDDFEETPKMSTYLVAFHISDLVLAQKSDPLDKNLASNDEPSIRIWTRKEYENMTNFGFTMISDALPILEEYFGVKTNLPKIDFVAVPEFGFNAMENWGLITLREASILVPAISSKSSSVGHMTKVAGNLVHELTHQWFGNLVTMKWFDDLWMKEGFATYLSYFVIDKIKPEWNHFKTFTVVEMHKAMTKDSDKLTHPISFPVNTKSDIRRIFDPISYSKSACIINMMRAFLGEHTFKQGLQRYLNKFKYGNAVQDDLWEIMTEAAHRNGVLSSSMTVKEIMDTWIHQKGYPVVMVRRNGSDIIITQEHFRLPEKDINDNEKWFVPISYTTSERQPESEIPEYWLTPKDDSIVIEGVVGATEYIYLNVNRTGYYRVNYDTDSWKYLILNLMKLPPLTRSQLVDDAFNLARANLVPYDYPLTIGLILRNDPTDFESWWAFEDGIRYLTNMVKREPAYEAFRTILQYLFKELFNVHGFDEKDDESHSQLLHRARVVKLACEFGIDRCTNHAQILYRVWMTDKLDNKVPPNLKETIYCTSMREGGSAEWNFLHKRYLETTSASEKEVILSSLGCTEKPWLLSKYLNMTLSSVSGIRKQDGARAFSSIAKNAFGFEAAYDFLYTNIAEISEYYGDGFATISQMIDALTTNMNKEYHKDQFKRFAEKARKLGLVAIEKSIKLAEIEIDKNIYWRNSCYGKFKSLLEQLIKDLNLNIV